MTFARRDFILSAAAFAASAGVARAEEEDDEGVITYPLLDQNAPAFSLPRLGGGASALSDYAGRVLILTFGGLWCPACISDGANINRIAAMAAAHAQVDYLYLQCGPGLGLWTQTGGNRRPRVPDAERAWAVYFTENHYDFPVAFDLSRRGVADRFGVSYFPTNLIIDRAGVIRAWRTSLGRRADDFFQMAVDAYEIEDESV